MAATLAQLRGRARVLADMVNTQFLTDSEFNDLVNDGIDALWADVTSVNKDFRVRTMTFSITSTATPFVALPGDFREVRYVRRDPLTTNQKILNKLTMRSGSMQAEQSYRLQDSSLWIEPFLNSVAAYDMLYVPWSPRLGRIQVRLTPSSALPAASGSGSGPGKTLTALANGALSVDGIAVSTGDRLLLNNAATGGVPSADLGIYVVTNPGSAGTKYILTRATDFDTAIPGEVAVGATAIASEGTTNINIPYALQAFGGTIDVSTQSWGVATLDVELDQFAEYIVLYATIKALGKEESDTQAATFLALFDPDGDGKKGERGRVMRWASDQRSADPDQVEDVRGSRRSRTNWPAF